MLVLYDHEEVGSLSATGADGAALTHLLERLSLALGFDRDVQPVKPASLWEPSHNGFEPD